MGFVGFYVSSRSYVIIVICVSNNLYYLGMGGGGERWIERETEGDSVITEEDFYCIIKVI